MYTTCPTENSAVAASGFRGRFPFEKRVWSSMVFLTLFVSLFWLQYHSQGLPWLYAIPWIYPISNRNSSKTTHQSWDLLWMVRPRASPWSSTLNFPISLQIHSSFRPIQEDASCWLVCLALNCPSISFQNNTPTYKRLQGSSWYCTSTAKSVRRSLATSRKKWSASAKTRSCTSWSSPWHGSLDHKWRTKTWPWTPFWKVQQDPRESMCMLFKIS